MNLNFFAEFLEGMTNELRTIVVNNSSWDIEAVDDMILYEANDVGSFTSLRGTTSAHFEM